MPPNSQMDCVAPRRTNIASSKSERPAGVEIGFLTLDVPAAFSQAVAAGAVPLAEPKVMPWGATVAYLQSPEGTIVGLSTPMPGQSV